MRLALAEASAALEHDDVPIGAVVVDAAGGVLAVAGNERELAGDPTAHAEVLALRRAAERVGSWRLSGCTLVVTLEPCVMCAGALVLARVAETTASPLATFWRGELYSVGRPGRRRRMPPHMRLS